MLINLLESSAQGGTGSGNWMWLIILIPLVALMVFNHFSNKKRREQAEAEREKRNAIRPGFKVTTIGGIVGTVVSVDDEANSFVLETGSSDNVCHIKFDKVAIYSSEDPNAPVEEPVEENEEIIEVPAEGEEVVDINDEVEENTENDGDLGDVE